MVRRFAIEFLKSIAIIVALPLATGFVTMTAATAYWFLFERNEDPLGIAIVGMWASIIAFFIAVVIVLRRIADVED